MAVSELKEIKLAGQTDIGVKRSNNQDAFRMGLLGDGQAAAYAVLCDGLGGHLGGHIASAETVEIVCAQINRAFAREISEQTLRLVLKAAVSTANAVVHEKGKRDSNLLNMGTTLELAVVMNSTLFAVHVGDSRIYLIRDGEIEQLTADHTPVQMMVDMGKLTPEEAKTHPDRHYITRAVGMESELSVDFFQRELFAGDILLLCSDGLTNHLEASEILSAVLSGSIDTVPTQLIKQANLNGGSDNITVALLYCL